jgi:hypothetical protein
MFQWSDAWLLLSLIYAHEPADRDHLRMVGDFINHAIFTDEELDGGLARLVEHGHAIACDGRFGPGPQVLNWFATITAGKSRTYVFKDLERVETYLGVRSNIPCQEIPKRPHSNHDDRPERHR